MLLTDDFTLKPTNFGEARAIDQTHTMTTVGTPIFMAPEIFLNEFYDTKADVYSFGVCLAAMIRAESRLTGYFFKALRKSLKKKSFVGIGIIS
jgi:serine/threonine protein kinase